MWNAAKLLQWSACQGGAGQGTSYCGYAEIGTLTHPTLARRVWLAQRCRSHSATARAWGVSASDFCVPAI